MHISEVHEGKKPYECSTCDKTFKGNQTLHYHIASIYEGIKPYKCHISKQNFTAASSFKSKSHQSIMVLDTIANYVKSLFSIKGSLHKHIKEVHENIRPYHCTVCEQTFKRKFDLETHTSSAHEKER